MSITSLVRTVVLASVIMYAPVRCLCAEPAPRVPGDAVERTLTLDDCVEIALHNSQDLLAFAEQIEYAKQRVNEARAQNFPKIDLNLNASKFANETPTILSPSFGSLYLPDAVKDFYYSTRLSLWQYLYASGRYTTNVRLAEINLSQIKTQSDVAHNKVILDVKKAFYACRILQEKIALHRRELSSASAKKVSFRTAQSYDDALMNVRLQKSEHEYAKSCLQFLDIIGLELDTKIALTGELILPDDACDLNKCMAWAFEYRPELRQTQFQETIDSLRVNLSLSERYPTVTLGANYEWFGDNLPLNQKNWNATINVNLPIFDGWASWYRVKQRRNMAREAKIRRANIQDQVRLDVKQAFLDYVFWRNQARDFDNRFSLENASDKKLARALLKLDTLEQVLDSQATLEWATGNIRK
ncbi:MAG: TolC family protein [Elusimicrobia bacterium]|nr:TolC family protein [Elusimicrobiota bacterium]